MVNYFTHTALHLPNSLSLASTVNDNIPQLQNLQSLITLAQANPELFSHLTSDAFFGTQPSNAPLLDLMSAQQQQPTTTTPSSIALASNNNNNNRSLNQVTNTISNISNSADALNQDIDDLGISLQALAQHLGFDPTKVSSNEIQDAPKLDDPVNEEDLIDMDEFLNTYGKKTLIFYVAVYLTCIHDRD